MSKIRITCIQNRGYIFDVDDYMRMRSEHRIVGNLVGCAAACPRNTNVNGLPAVLTAYEQQLLLDERLAIVCQSPTLPPTTAQATAYVDFCAQSIAEQRDHQRRTKLDESGKQIDRIIDGKRQKMLAAGVTPEVCDARLDVRSVLDEIDRQFVFQPENALVEVPTVLATECSQVDDEPVEPAESATAASLRYRVFRELWRHGKFVTSGDTFGGDFLCYPGDPMMYHASHIVHCLDGNGVISPTRLVANGRMSVLVNKLCVFAYVGSNGEVAFRTMEWDGNEMDA